MHTGKDYWKNYMDNWFGCELINQWEKNCREESILSNNESLHIEMYISGNQRPTLVFSHGIAGYARVLLPFILPLYEKGINIICPDLKGYGYNTHRKGDFTWNHHVSNLIDTVKYAGKKFGGPIFLGGASMGGPLAYEAATQIDDIAGIICWCLWDLSDREYVENETTMKKATFRILPFMKILNFLLGRMRIKTYSIVSYDTLTSVPEFNSMIKDDPQAGTLISLRGAFSLILQSKPTLPYEKWTKPIIIFQPGSDRMTPANYIRKVFHQIGSKDKKYIELKGSAHFPVEKKYYEKWSEEVYNFICLATSN